MDAKEAIECLENPDTSRFEKWLEAKHMAFEALEKVEALEAENARLGHLLALANQELEKRM